MASRRRKPPKMHVRPFVYDPDPHLDGGRHHLEGAEQEYGLKCISAFEDRVSVSGRSLNDGSASVLGFRMGPASAAA